jgi:diacylglycerol kinase family enzyme
LQTRILATVPRDVAVLVNRNAQGVTARHLEELRQLVGDRLYVTETIDAGRDAIRTIVERRCDALAIGGGDGTFMQVVTELLALGPATDVPVLVPLRLGTGNAIADVTGASKPTSRGIASDLARAAGDEPARSLKLIEVDGKPTHFTGVGLDADYAADFRWLVKDRKLTGVLGRLSRGAPGLAITAATMTIPRLLARTPRRMRIVALDAPAWRLTEHGERSSSTIAPGELLYDGPFTIAAASTIHSYSNGMTFFPFAEALDDAFQVRVSALTGFETLAALPRSFDGTYRHPKVHDFAARAIAVELDEPARYHVGGDLHGPSTSFTVRLAARSVPMLFRAQA